MRPRAVEFILFHLNSVLANRVALEICLAPVPCTGFSSRSYVGGVTPRILSPFITAQQFKDSGCHLNLNCPRTPVGAVENVCRYFCNVHFKCFWSNLIGSRRVFCRGNYNPDLFISNDYYSLMARIEFRGNEVFVWELITQLVWGNRVVYFNFRIFLFNQKGS